MELCDARGKFGDHERTKSEFLPVNYGIPQGSLLGPFLFMFLTSDLPSSVKSGELFMCADDTTVYCIGENVDQAVVQLNKALADLYTWCLNNRLTPHRKSVRRFLYPGLVSSSLLHQSGEPIFFLLIESANPNYLALWWTIS